MVLDEMNALYNPWVLLQQPVHPVSGTSASFRALLAVLDQGWQVVEPVRVLPTPQEDVWVYYWILMHPLNPQTKELFVPAVQAVERFVEQNHFQVVEGNIHW